jgi:hypothetical protein
MQRGELLSRMAALASQVPALREQAQAARGPAEPALLESDNDSLASALLQERVQALVAQAGANLASVETLAAEEAGPYRRIRLRVALSGRWPELMGLLQALGGSMPRLLVDDLQMQPALHRISTAPGTFDASLTIFAFRRAAAGGGR